MRRSAAWRLAALALAAAGTGGSCTAPRAAGAGVGAEDGVAARRHGDERVRERAALTLGRLPWPECGAAATDALLGALADESPRVRAAAAFGLGLRGDPAAGDALIEALRAQDPDPLVRARLVEAASRIERADVRTELLYSIADLGAQVRAEVAVAAHRFGDALDPELVDSVLATAALREGEGPEVVWRALFSLARRASERGREAFLLWSRPARPVEARIFALQGLAAIAADERTLAALREGLADADWRVACEAARGLEAHPDPRALPSLERALGHASAHVRATAAAALGALAGQRAAVAPLLERLTVDASPNVRAAAIEAEARLLGDERAAALELRALDADPRVRAGVARACAHLGDALAVPLLVRLTRDADRWVAYQAAEGLGAHLDREARERLYQLLEQQDNGLRLGALLALAAGPRPGDLPHLEQVWRTSAGDVADELRQNVIEIAGHEAVRADDRARALLVEGMRSPTPYVRALARRTYAGAYPAADLPPAGPPLRRLGEPPPVPAAGTPDPIVEVRTTKGTMVFELFPAEAPAHVFNLLELARAGHYDGLRFHRVVPDFVIQGGDYRGDGNGGVTWRGEPLRHEFGPRKYLRGSLGMPRNADVDSGGSQFFVTHRPTPHLDGRYTILGELRQGFDVLDAIEVGDLIVTVRERGAGGAE